MRLTYTAQASGRGSGPTAGELLNFIGAVPPTAATSVSADTADRPGEMSGWRIEATWSQAEYVAWLAGQAPKPRPPAKRGAQPDWDDLQRHQSDQRDLAADQRER